MMLGPLDTQRLAICFSKAIICALLAWLNDTFVELHPTTLLSDHFCLEIAGQLKDSCLRA